MPTGIRIDATPEQLEHVVFNHDGLVPVIAQDIHNREVLMMAWMNNDSLARTFDEGRMVYWVAQPARTVAQGRHQRRPPVRA